MVNIDAHPKEAVTFLLGMIAHHRRCAHAAAEPSPDISFRYYEACRKEAEEALAFYEKHWPEETAAARDVYPLIGAAASRARLSGYWAEEGAEAATPAAVRPAR
ncbi:MAG: hypothetical protein WB611_11045 [Stellaceae bacterium]